MLDEAANKATDGEVTEYQVTNDEVLYRRVPQNTPQLRYYDRSGSRVLVAPFTFSERPIPDGEPFAGQYRLSVDRAKLRGFNPDLTRQDVPGRDPESFGVVSMPAEEVRAIAGVADIIPDPILNHPVYPNNPAHALICVVYKANATKTANKNKMREVTEELAAAANRRPWEIDPPGDGLD